jgi:ankyrin repeat protein
MSYSNDFINLCKTNVDVKLLKMLLKHGADVHAYGNEALCSASRNGHTEVVKLLKESVNV